MLVDDEDARLLRDYAELDAGLLLPIDNPLALLRYHEKETLRQFHRQCRAEFEHNSMLVALPPELVTTTRDDIEETIILDSGVLPAKRVYHLDSQRYVFIDETDCALLTTLPSAERLRFQNKYAGCIYSITRPGESSSSVVDTSDIPLDNPKPLLLHHGKDLSEFCQRHRHRFLNNKLLVRLPEPVSTSHIDMTRVLPRKRVYQLGDCQYVFISDDDCALVATLTCTELKLFERKYKGCIYSIATPPSSTVVVTEETQPGTNNKRARDDEDDALTTVISLKTTVATKKPRIADESVDTNNELKSMLVEWKRDYDNVVARNKELQLEKELAEARHRIQLQEMELACHRQMHQFLTSGRMASSFGAAIEPVGVPLALTASGGCGGGGGVTRVSEWIGANRYGQQHLGSERHSQNAYQKWDCMFDNASINAQHLHSLVQVVRHDGYRHRLQVPLTYQYNLRTILVTLRDHTSTRRAHWDTLIAACPVDYQVVLFATNAYGDPTLCVTEHTRNCVALATHLHFIMSARAIDRNATIHKDKWKTRCDSLSQPQARFVPDLSIIEEYYPSSLHFGSNTLMTFDMCLRTKYQKAPKKSESATTASPTKKQQHKKKQKTGEEEDDSDNDEEDDGGVEAKKGSDGVGTGNGKNCQLCKSLAMSIKKTGSTQCSHHTNTCPLLAVLSNNEVDILNQIILACRHVEKKKTNPLPKLKFFFGLNDKPALHRHKNEAKNKKNAKTGLAEPPVVAAPSPTDVMKLGESTLLRHATPEELLSGQHVNGLRLNRARYMRLRQEVYTNMRTHLDGDLLFGTMDPTVQQAIDELFGLQDVIAENGGRMPLVRQLIYDSDGKSFIASKFDEAKRPLRNFTCSAEGGDDDGLFFSFEPNTAPTPRMVAQSEFFQRAKLEQQMFVAMYGDKSFAFPAAVFGHHHQFMMDPLLSFGPALH
jgi:hypothetical protein